MEVPYKAQNFEITINNLKPTVTRNFSFTNGDSISFTVTLEENFDATIKEIHQQSVIAAINHLKALIPPQ